jgi:hypothetical protein
MKKIILSFGLVILFIGINSCAKKQIDELTEFDIAYSNTVVVPATTLNNTVSATAPIDIKTPDVPTNSSSSFSSNKTSSDLISEIKMKSLTISVPSGNLDFIKSVSIYINATGLSEALVASKSVIPSGQTSVVMDMGDVNIKDYIKKDNISFRVTGTVQTGTGQLAQTIKLDEVVHVKATLIK